MLRILHIKKTAMVNIPMKPIEKFYTCLTSIKKFYIERKKDGKHVIKFLHDELKGRRVLEDYIHHPMLKRNLIKMFKKRKIDFKGVN